MHQALRRKVVKAVQRPAAQHHMQQMSWLRSHVSSTEASKNVKAKRPLVLSHTLFHEGRLSKESESLVRWWDESEALDRRELFVEGEHERRHPISGTLLVVSCTWSDGVLTRTQMCETWAQFGPLVSRWWLTEDSMTLVEEGRFGEGPQSRFVFARVYHRERPAGSWDQPLW